MGLFSKKQKYLGVDIGTASLKICELENIRGRATLSTYGLATLPNDLIRNDSPEVISEITQALKEIIDKANITSRKAVAALPGYSVFTFEVELPMMSDEDFESAIRFEAEKYIPVPINEMVVDWEIIEEVISQNEKSEKQKLRRVLLTAAPRNLVARYTTIFEGAGLELDSLETEAMALVRSLVGEDKSPILILDMGATATDICLVDGGFPRLSKGIDIGGGMVTEAIAESLNIDVAQAEQFKKDFGLLASDKNSDVPDTVRSIMDEFIIEIQKVLDLYYDKRGRSIEKIILTGGSARLKGLGDYIERTLNTKVYAGNPWARVVTPARIHDSVKRIGPEFSVAIGLAMRNIY